MIEIIAGLEGAVRNEIRVQLAAAQAQRVQAQAAQRAALRQEIINLIFGEYQVSVGSVAEGESCSRIREESADFSHIDILVGRITSTSYRLRTDFVRGN